MRSLLIISIAAFTLGAFAIVLVLLSAGVPYHDGPNSGYVNPPGLLRSVENASPVLLLIGAGALLIGIVGLLVYVMSRFTSRKSGA